MKANQTFTAEAMRQEAMCRRLGDPDVVGTIWRWDHLDVLTEREAEWWDTHALPMGWWIRGDSRAARAAQFAALPEESDSAPETREETEA